ncbi:toxin-antitoxin system, toxin component [Streptomyces sp. NPDC014894]|uniref:toxin-antitoxin system, toxin component n=1 Tax=unclassified Streptomyces TaxID=2593676 RepID=UPI0037012200
MSTAARSMRQLSARLVRHLRTPADEGDVIPAIGEVLTQVRGRPVRLRKAAFPPGTASGLWVDRTGHDLIAYEENTDPEHQLVIIGHEAWHMFQGHCGNATAHGPAASRAAEYEPAGALADLAAEIARADDAEGDPATRRDAALQFAARADARNVHEEVEAELFGIRFATDVQAALAEIRTPADPHNLAGRIRASMAHRIRRI